MPRDLVAEKESIWRDMPALQHADKTNAQQQPPNPSSASPSVSLPPNSSSSAAHHDTRDKISRDMDKQDAWSALNPYTKSLTPSDVDSCVALENVAFAPQERATKEKFLYRFSKCGELCLGLFTSGPTTSDSIPTAATAQPVSSNEPDRRAILLAHCVATKSNNDAIQDEDMDVPHDWQTLGTMSASCGHQEAGRTICIHSLAVVPSHQGKGLGSTLMKAYIQRMEQSQAGDRIALLAHGELVAFYEKLGFVNKGPSKAQFGGGNWVDMIYTLKQPSKP